MEDIRLQPLPSEDTVKFLAVLEKKLPDSIVPYHFIKIQKYWAKQNPGQKVRILTINGNWRDGSCICLVDGIVENKSLAVIYASGDNESNIKLAAMSSKLIKWKQIKIYYSVHERHIQMLREILQFAGCNYIGDTENRCVFYYLPSKVAADIKLPKLPENVRVEPLNENHLDALSEHWPIYDDDYTQILLNSIKLNLTIGVFVRNDDGEEELASMVVQREYGAVGMLQTVPEHRRKGYAAIALAYITKRIGQQGIMPFATVLVHNRASRSLFEKMNFEVLGVSTYVDTKE